MAFVGVLSTMLLHEQLVVRPNLAPLASPTRVVVGARVVSELATTPHPSFVGMR